MVKEVEDILGDIGKKIKIQKLKRKTATLLLKQARKTKRKRLI